jgi:hypothetical protein
MGIEAAMFDGAAWDFAGQEILHAGTIRCAFERVP